MDLRAAYIFQHSRIALWNQISSPRARSTFEHGTDRFDNRLFLLRTLVIPVIPRDVDVFAFLYLAQQGHRDHFSDPALGSLSDYFFSGVGRTILRT